MSAGQHVAVGDDHRVDVQTEVPGSDPISVLGHYGLVTSRQTTIESTDGVRLALHRLAGEGPPLLICHATGFHGRAYQPVADAMAGDFAVWALDFRAHGSSTPPVSGNFSWNGMADDVLAAVDHIAGGPIRAVGHSLGGAAILLAELQRPGAIIAAYLFEPVVFGPDYLSAHSENPMAGPARRRRPEFESRQAALERYGSRPPLNLLRADALAAYVEYGFVETDEGTVRLACDPEHEARTFEAEGAMTFDRIDGMKLRSMVAYGASIPGVPSPGEAAPQIAECIDGAVERHYPNFGHFGPFEDPERIAADIVTFLR